MHRVPQMILVHGVYVKAHDKPSIEKIVEVIMFKTNMAEVVDETTARLAVGFAVHMLEEWKKLQEQLKKEAKNG